MKQPGEVGARRHADSRKWLLDGACAADAVAAFERQDALSGAREVSCAGESIVAGPHDDGVPPPRYELFDRGGKAYFAERSGGGSVIRVLGHGRRRLLQLYPNIR